MNSMDVNVFYFGNDPNDIRTYGNYKNVKYIKYSEDGYLFIDTLEDSTVIERMFVDGITIKINK